MGSLPLHLCAETTHNNSPQEHLWCQILLWDKCNYFKILCWKFFFGERQVGSEKVDLIFFRLPNPPNLLNPTPPQPTDAFHSLTHLFLSFFQNFVSSVFHISMISLDFCFFRIWNFRFKIPTTWLILNCSSQHLFKFSDVSYFQATIYNIFLRSWHL